jgi:magnesium-transporting ATPase (P-type)
MDIAGLLAIISIASLPLGLQLSERFVPRFGPTSAVHALTSYNTRSTLLAEVLLVLTAVIAKAIWSVPLALTAAQLVLFNLLFLLPLRALMWEHRPHYTKDTDINTLLFGALAAGLAYANFVLYFDRQGLGLSYTSTNNPYYFKATAVALTTLFLCQSLNLLFSRLTKRQQFFTRGLLINKKLLLGFAISLFLLLNALYNPLLNFFHTGSLSLGDWLWTVLAASIYLGFRQLQRHTRKHSRGEVIRQHHEAAKKFL